MCIFSFGYILRICLDARACCVTQVGADVRIILVSGYALASWPAPVMHDLSSGFASHKDTEVITGGRP